jgi:hypothetical protein
MPTHYVDLILLRHLYCGQAKSDSHVASLYKLNKRHNIIIIMEKGYQTRSMAFSLNPSRTQKKEVHKDFFKCRKMFMGCTKIIFFPRKKVHSNIITPTSTICVAPKVIPSKLSHHLELFIHEQIPHPLSTNFWSRAPFLEIQI